MSRRYKRKRPLRGKNKPHTVHEEATLLTYLRCYKFMCKRPRLWFANQTFAQSELAEVYEAGLHHVAIELGYKHRQPLEVMSKPIVASVTRVTDEAA